MSSSCPKPLNPPPYQSTPNHPGYHHIPGTFTDARDESDDNENVNLSSSQHSNYGSVHPLQKPTRNKTTRLLNLVLIIAISLNIAVTFFLFYPTTQAHEKIRRKWEAEEREHQRREEEERRALIVWENLTPSNKCLRYGTREYSATLAHVPLGLDPLKECWKKSIDIHGQQILPSRCDTQGMCGAVTGHWIVNFNEATCVTWWDKYYDKGCVERGIHRYESRLMNLQGGDNWQEICATTPGHIQGKDFDGPTSCATWWPSGVHGIWLIEDANCY